MPTVGLEFILNSPLATSAPGGTNAARVQNDVGDLCLWSSNNVGMRITAGTGAVGVGKTAAIGVALDVSGSLHSSNVVTGPIFGTSLNGGCISDSLTLTSSAIAASAMALSNVNVVASGALQRSGGVVTGMLSCSNLSVLGSIETVNAFVTMSSNVVITNSGTGTALTVSQTGSQPVAQFSASGSTALFISSTANVGIGKAAPINFQLDVSGNVNISGAAIVASIAAVTHTGTNMELTGTTQTSNLIVTGMSTFTSNVGVGKAPIAGGAVFDVSGNINASGLIGCISNSVTTTSSTIAASATAVKAANDLAALALPKSGGAVTGSLAVNKPSVTGTYALDVSGSVAVSGDIFCNNNKYLKATNGYAALPGGILIQWGFNNCTSTSTTVNFPISFSSAPYSITATVSDPGYGSGTATSVVGIQNWGAPTSTLFYIGFKPMSGSSFAATNVNWMAIGPV